MSDPTPVPLGEIDSHTIDVGPVWCPTCKREFGNTEAEALREALRIAVEALDVYLADDDNDTIPPDVAGRALADVRELVDLGGNDGP